MRGQSYDLNIKHLFYFDLASRGYSDFKYLGIYKWKSVRQIGLLENVIEADWDEVTGLNIIKAKSSVTDEQKEKLSIAIKDSIDQGWDLKKDHRFFLLSNLTATDFIKTSPGGIFRVRFFNLENVLEVVPEDIKMIAEQLKYKTWE